MTTTEFLYWLQGTLNSTTDPNKLDLSLIKRRLDLVIANVPGKTSESTKLESPKKQTLFG